MAYGHYRASRLPDNARGDFTVLSLWRRHLQNCPHRKKGPSCIKCSCPIWCDGEIDGKGIRKAMDTRDWARATRKLAKIEDQTYGLQECEEPGCTEFVPRGRMARFSSVPQKRQARSASGVDGACSHRSGIPSLRRPWKWAALLKRPPISLAILRRVSASTMPSGAPEGKRVSLIFWHVYGTRKNQVRKLLKGKEETWWTW